MLSANNHENQGDNTDPLRPVSETAQAFGEQVQSAKYRTHIETTVDKNTKTGELEQRNAELNIKVLEQSAIIITLMREKNELAEQNEKLKQENKSKDQLNEELHRDIKVLEGQVALLNHGKQLLERYHEDQMAKYSQSPNSEALGDKSSSSGLELALTSASTSTSALSLSLASLNPSSILKMISARSSPAKTFFSSPARTSALKLPPAEPVFSKRHGRRPPDSPDKQNPSPAKTTEVQLSLKDKPSEFKSSVATPPSHARSIDGNDQVPKDLPATHADSHSPKLSNQDSHFSSRSRESSKKPDNPPNKITSGSESKDFDLSIQRDEKKQRSSIKSAGIIFEMSTKKEIEITYVENGSNPDDIDKEKAKNLYNYFAKQSSEFFNKSFEKKEFIYHFSSQGIKVEGDIEADLEGFIKHFEKIYNKHLKSTKPTSARNLTSARSLKFGNEVKQGLSGSSSGGSSR